MARWVTKTEQAAPRRDGTWNEQFAHQWNELIRAGRITVVDEHDKPINTGGHNERSSR